MSTQSKLTTKSYLLHICLANAQGIGFKNVTLIPVEKSELCLYVETIIHNTEESILIF